jgi:phenylacetic acid degradation operon negative regulatory protein
MPSRNRATPPANDSAATPGQLTSSEPLQPQDLVLTLLGAYVKPHHETVWSGGLVELLGEMGFSPGAARVALTRLVNRELIRRVRDGRLVHYALTPRSARLLKEGDGRIFSLGRRDDPVDSWTVLWHQVPEDRRLERARLARRLRFLGFGSMQDGLWVSPRDRQSEVAPLIEESTISEYVGIFLGRWLDSNGNMNLLRTAWDLETLTERYRAFAEEFAPYTSRKARRALGDKHAFLVRTRLVHSFRGFPFLDPDLPDEFMPEPKIRRTAVDVFHTTYDGLAEPAQRHFDQVTGAWRESRSSQR